MDDVARHYQLGNLLETILGRLATSGKDLDSLVPDDLAGVDEFHIRGREATVELASLASVSAADRVIDVGSGLGGSSRYLAASHGCRVDGVDLTPEYCETARELTRRVGLSERAQFHCASALATPFEDDTFDVAWTQHVQMNIADKAGLYREIHRVLKPGGRFVFHDILAGPEQPAHYPTHWAEQEEMSHLIAPDALRQVVEECGFRVVEWRDTTDIAREWYLAAAARAQRDGPPELGLHLLLGETGPDKFANVGRNLSERRLTVYQGLLESMES